MKVNVLVFLATGGWIGYSPVAPGTFGSLVALPLCLLLTGLPIVAAVVCVSALVLLSVGIAHRAESILGRKDPKQVVIDEICGMTIAMLGLPFTSMTMVGGFALFRLFDILKPFPIRWVDRNLSGGWGIVLDDVIAGVMANALFRAGTHWFG